MVDLNELLAKAKAATPGSWITGEGSHWSLEVRSPKQSVAFCGATNGLNDAAFIAAANPAVVIELCETMRRPGDKCEMLAPLAAERLKAVQDEREACAKIVEQSGYPDTVATLAAAIRERG